MGIPFAAAEGWRRVDRLRTDREGIAMWKRKSRSVRGELSTHGKTDRERFETRFRVTPGCWIWLHGKDQDGYGQFRASGKNWRAHRFSYHCYVGDIPDDMVVMHRCDNPECVNPDHLIIGTNQDNTADRHRKGRSAKGSWSWHRAKLTRDQVLEIRSSQGHTVRALAKKYGVSHSTIVRVKNGEGWNYE